MSVFSDLNMTFTKGGAVKKGKMWGQKYQKW